MKTLYFALFCSIVFNHQGIGQTTLPNFQDFEGGVFPPTNWQVFHGNGNTGSTDWELSPNGVGANTSSYSILFNNIGVASTFYVIRCEPLNLLNAIAPILSFDVAYARFDNSHTDNLSLWYTTNVNGVEGWTRVSDATTLSDVTYSGSGLDTAPNQTTYFTPTSSQWETKIVDLANYSGETFIRFAFESTPNNDNGSNVIYIDNVHFYDTSPLALSNEIKTKFKLYPNPSNGKIQINTAIKNLNIDNFKITNVLGKVQNEFNVYQNISGYQLNLDHLKKGIYFLSVFSSNYIETKKIIIQ